MPRSLKPLGIPTVMVGLSTSVGTVVSELPLGEHSADMCGPEALAGQLARQLLMVLTQDPGELDRRWSAAWAVRRNPDGRGALARVLGAEARGRRDSGRQGLEMVDVRMSKHLSGRHGMAADGPGR